MNEYQKALMNGPSIDTGNRCAICGRHGRVERHHIVPRSAGGTEGPTVSLCGHGSNLSDGSGRMWHHGAAHHHMLHFRFDGREWWYLVTAEPTKYERALGMDGWEPMPWSGGTEEVEYSDEMPWLHTVRTDPVHYVWKGDRPDGWEPPF